MDFEDCAGEERVIVGWEVILFRSCDCDTTAAIVG